VFHVSRLISVIFLQFLLRFYHSILNLFLYTISKFNLTQALQLNFNWSLWLFLSRSWSCVWWRAYRNFGHLIKFIEILHLWEAHRCDHYFDKWCLLISISIDVERPVLVENDRGFATVSVLDFKISFPKSTKLIGMFVHIWIQKKYRLTNYLLYP